VYPEGKGRLFYYVRVFRTVADMLAHLRHKDYSRRPGRFCKGMCSSWTRLTVPSRCQRRAGQRVRVLPEMGEIVFAVGWMGAGVIAHESTHAVLAWARRLRLDPHESAGRNCSKAEERFCYAHGEIVRQIAVQAWKRGFAK